MAASTRASLRREAEAIATRFGSVVGSEEEEEEEEEDEEWESERIALAELEAERNGRRKEVTNDVQSMERSLSQFGWKGIEMDWKETLSVSLGEDAAQVNDVDDDLQRELAFYRQALVAAQQAANRFERDGMPWRRPDDYYAEMIKSDVHMEKVRKKLLEERSQMEAVEQAKKARENKRYAKQVEAEKRKQKAQARKREIESVSKWRKERKRNGFADDADLNGSSGWDGSRSKQQIPRFVRGTPKGDGIKSKKRQYKDSKFGFGGPKGRMKQNDSISAADVSGYKPAGFDKKNLRAKGGKVQKKAQAKRPGKAKREKRRNSKK